MIVVSPLVALMKDQVKALCERGASAVYTGDVNDAEELEEVCSGEKQFIYISPESLLTDLTLFRAQCSRLTLLVLLLMRHTV